MGKKKLQFMEKTLGQLAKEIIVYKNEQLKEEDWQEMVYPLFAPELMTSSYQGSVIHYNPIDNNYIIRGLTIKALEAFYNHIKSLKVYEKSLVKFALHQRNQEGWVGEIADKMGAFVLDNFVSRILTEENDIDMLVRVASQEVLGMPASWICKVSILGFTPEEEVVSAGRLTIRVPVVEDFPLRIGRWSNGRVLDPSRTDTEQVQTILEWKQEGIPRGMNARQELTTAILDKMRLFRLSKGGRWIVSGWDASTDWVIEMSHYNDKNTSHNLIGKRMSEPDTNAFPIVQFTKDDASKYEELETKVFGILNNQYYGVKAASRALAFYDEATQRKPLEAILFTTIGLESLYARQETEQQFKMATRVTVALTCEEYQRATIFDDVLDAYRIRNDFVHGAPADEEKAKKIGDRLLEYLRRSILLWLQSGCLSKKKMKEMHKALERGAIVEDDFKKARAKFKDAIF